MKSIKTYSQNFEDVMLLRALGNVANGYYIDVGAAEPDTDSVTYALHQIGWRGINIEPNQSFFEKIVNSRHSDINLKIALSNYNGQAEFYCIENTGLSTLNYTVSEGHKQFGYVARLTTVDVRTLKQIWECHIPRQQDVHLLKVDVSGSEFEVISGNDWSVNRPWVVVVDAHYPLSQIETHGDWEPILFNHDYVFAYADGLNRFYISRERSFLLHHFKYPPNVFDNCIINNGINFTNNHGNRQRQLLVDISMLMSIDVKTGIQRVVRAILREWLQSPPHGVRVEPIYATVNESYRYARSFTASVCGQNSQNFTNDLVVVQPGDIFIGLDLTQYVTCVQRNKLDSWRDIGVQIWFVVYDLLPIHLSLEWKELHEEWLRVVTQYNGVVCISRSVAEDVRSWLSSNGALANPLLKIKWFHLGADVSASLPTLGVPDNSAVVLNTIQENTCFLMVGTIEPRKGHAQVLDAFEILWKRGLSYRLIIVGKVGWDSDNLVERLRNHPELGRCLFWLEGISDEYLEEIYLNCSCLICASHGEGFGLPLIEAAQHQLDILARDLPVFREVASDYAYYFSGSSGSDLVDAINRWVDLFSQGVHPKSSKMPWLTWKQSANMLGDIVCT